MPRLSPDGTRVAVARYDGMGGLLFVFGIARQVLSPLTPKPGRAFGAVWSSDGKEIAYAGFGEGEVRPFAKNADGSGTARALTEVPADAVFPNSWFPDGKALAAVTTDAADRGGTRLRGTSDIWIVPAGGAAKAHPWFETSNREIAPVVSPDGHFVAYVSDESGRNEVYLRSYPDASGKIQISNNGGGEPAWSRDGREILYREADRFMAVDVHDTPKVVVSTPRVLFAASFNRGSRVDIPRDYDVSRDGNVIVALRTLPSEPATRQLAVVTGWTGTLARPADRK